MDFAENVYARLEDSFAKACTTYDEAMVNGTHYNEGKFIMSLPTIVAANLAYFLTIFLLWRHFRREDVKSPNLKWVIFVYNGICVSLAAYVAGSMIYFKILNPGKFMCNSKNPADWTLSEAKWQAHLVFWFNAQKYWEFLDTCFFVMRKSWRQVTFLGLYHHSSITVVSALFNWYSFTGDFYLPCILNCTVHVFMYSHYMLSTLGVKSWWKPYLTIMQLTQFLLLAYQAIGSWIEGPDCGPPDFCKVTMMIYMFTMVLLFSNFFIKNYCNKRSDKKKIT